MCVRTCDRNNAHESTSPRSHRCRRPPGPPLPSSPAVTVPQHSPNQRISTVTLMSEIAYEVNLFPMADPDD